MKTYYSYKKNIPYLYYILGGTIFWLLLIVLAPLLKGTDRIFYMRLSEYIYFLFKPVCHQIPERSIILNSEPMAVCLRCFSIYFGGFLFILNIAIKRKIFHLNLTLVFLFSLPVVLDFLLEKFNIYTDIQLIRVLTGLLLGACISYLILFSIWDLNKKYLMRWKINHGKSKIN
jgi:uncharacterized membrane protein